MGGGVSREFFYKAISELMDPAKGVFRTVEGSTYYPNDDFVVADALQGSEERVLTFAGRLLGKALLEGHHVPAGFNGVLLKHLLALPVSLTDDLRLLDAEVARSLELIAATADLGGQQTSTIGALVTGFRDVVPAAALLLLESPEELREALAGVEALDVHEWRRETKLRGAFKDAPKHRVCPCGASRVATGPVWCARSTFAALPPQPRRF